MPETPAAREVKHTPGPWRIGIQSSTRVVGSDRRGVCTTGGPSDSTVEDWGLEENEANARLIAAAPELMAGLSLMLAWHDALREQGGIRDIVPSPVGIDKARAAIAKAEGEQP